MLAVWGLPPRFPKWCCGLRQTLPSITEDHRRQRSWGYINGRNPGLPCRQWLRARLVTCWPTTSWSAGRESHLPGVNAYGFLCLRGLRLLVTAGTAAPKPGLLQSQAPRPDLGLGQASQFVFSRRQVFVFLFPIWIGYPMFLLFRNIYKRCYILD